MAHLVLAILCWPGALIAADICLTAWTRARSAMGDLAVLSESAVDLYGRLRATELGVADKELAGPLTVEEGEQITAIVRKGR